MRQIVLLATTAIAAAVVMTHIAQQLASAPAPHPALAPYRDPAPVPNVAFAALNSCGFSIITGNSHAQYGTEGGLQAGPSLA